MLSGVLVRFGRTTREGVQGTGSGCDGYHDDNMGEVRGMDHVGAAG